MGEGGQSYREAVEAARRVYDKQVAKLEEIDDKAMRTARTGILVMGFIAAALTNAGADAVSSLPNTAAIAGGLGTAAVVASSFVSIGIYTMTEYPFEIQGRHIDAADDTPPEEWLSTALDRLKDSSIELAGEIKRNAEYLEMAQLFLLLGIIFLVYSSSVTILRRSYGIVLGIQPLSFLIGAGAALLGQVLYNFLQ
ncbi:hypothetical protein ACNO8S_16420 (plasmid) [Haloarcula sp. KBTZ06]|uniref:hypothetical protein n=1 Tax=Haloarcula sp. KBTZ06 TaxID=3402682 RepID=UPI003B43BC64